MTPAAADLRAALRAYGEATKALAAAIEPFISTGLEITPDRSKDIADAIHVQDVARDAYYDALEAAGRPVPEDPRRGKTRRTE